MPADLTGDYTPFGYLRNPGHRATSWREVSGGNLLTSTAYVGLEWAYPVAREARRRVGLGLEMVVDGRVYRTRGDFRALGLRSGYHSCLILGFDWQVEGLQVAARYFLASDDALCVRLSVVNEAESIRAAKLQVFGWVDDHLMAAPSDADEPCLLTEQPEVHCLARDGLAIDGELAAGAERRLNVVLSRGPKLESARAAGDAALAACQDVFQSFLAEDAEFAAGCPTLEGDWPAHWREGLIYDFETTRLLVQPAGGIFADVWPSWMAAWPRVVLAEGVLDMLRLAYADPALAQRAVLSLFRDAPLPNVPCVFEGGEFTMVAADGSRCGTSPAWCLPFLNLELLYLRTLDRHWLGELYPYASAYVRWWLDHRVDADGWLVYRCTWESGEDGNPRLDPTTTGDADISARLRPVELQATLSHAAGVLAFFAVELERPDDAQIWLQVKASYRDRTRELFDAQAGRYRDWLIAEAEFQAPRPDQPYWGIDARRFSAQSLTPLLIGEPLDAAEVWRHAGPPWTVWPSWTLSLVESAAAAGLLEGVGRLAAETIDRVYRVTTRREPLSALHDNARPLPGGAPEFWPLDWSTYDGSDAYGWGATTANLLIRHVFGFKESHRTDGWVVDLAPAIPDALLADGRRFAIRHLNYRGLVFDLAYTYQPGGSHIEVELDLGATSRQCTVTAGDRAAQVVYASPHAASVHSFHLVGGQPVTVRLNLA